MKRIWLIRHGESTAQALKHHDPDPDLTSRGCVQAERLTERLAEVMFDEIYLSPLKRARRSFELSKAQGKRVSFDSRLIECAFDVCYENMLPYRTPDCAAADTQDAWRWPSDRRAESLLHMLRECSGREIALFGHWGIFTMLLLRFMGAPVPPELQKNALALTAPTANGAVSILVMGHPKYHDCILHWNDCSHLAGVLDGPLEW